MATTETTPDLAAEYVRGINAAASLLRTFDQDLPGFDRATCKRLTDGVAAMGQSAAERLGVTPADPDKPELDNWDSYLEGIRDGADFAVRGRKAEAWIKAARDKYPKGSDAWLVLDNLLDDYREYAYVGCRLGESITYSGDPTA